MKKIEKLIFELNRDLKKHQEVGPRLNDEEIEAVERQLNLNLPNSYKSFLKLFGDGGFWIYYQPIDSIQNYSWLNDYRKQLPPTIELVEGTFIKTDSLLCLMTEDSNGGAWCWLTTEADNDGEWPLAYYNMEDEKLYYKVNNFTEWLSILVECEAEVIRKLDTDEILGLG
jgi:hypothetical protein